MQESVDKTIVEIGNWIQNQIGSQSMSGEVGIISEMTKALADLVTARARINEIN